MTLLQMPPTCYTPPEYTDSGDIGSNFIADMAEDFNKGKKGVILLGANYRSLKRYSKQMKKDGYDLDSSRPLELRILIYDENGVQANKTSGHVHYFEISQLQARGFTIDNAVTEFHNNNDHFYSTLAPVTNFTEFSSQTVFQPEEQYVFRGMSTSPLSRALIAKNELAQLTSGFDAIYNMPGSKRERTNRYLQETRKAHTLVLDWFKDANLDNYMLPAKKHVRKQHKKMPYFDIKHIKGWSDLDKMEIHPLIKASIYAGGTNAAIQNYITEKQQWKFNKVHTCVGLGSLCAIQHFLKPDLVSLMCMTGLWWLAVDAGYRVFNNWNHDGLYAGVVPDLYDKFRTTLKQKP